VKSSGVAFEAVTPVGFDAAVERCRAELAREGFGVLSEIDIAAKLHEKLGVTVPPNLILGACHPPSAYRALTAVPEVAVLLPCNVTVAVEERGTVIRAMNPESAMQMFDDPEIAAVAREVGAALRRVVERSAA
jgi:uncharacterized protein (DUF302 family)